MRTRVASGAGYGAIGGAASAVLSPWVLGQIDPTHAPLDQGQLAVLAAVATFAGGGLAGLAGQNAMAGATAAQNEALNNSADHWGKNESEAQREQDELHKQQSKEKAQLGESSIVDEGNGVSVLSPNPMAFGGAKNTIAPPPNTYAVYPLGAGAAGGPLPPGYVSVSRWVSPAEASLWVQNQGTAIPSGIPQNGTPQVYVTTAGAPYPPGASGTVRIDFAVPSGMLQPGNASNNFQILQPSASRPIYNVTINVPNGVILPKAK